MEEEQIVQPTITEQTIDSLQAKQKVQEIIGADQTSFATLMLEEKSIPEPIRKILPVFADKEFALTNLKDEDIEFFKMLFEDAVNDYHLYTPHYEQTPEIEQMITQMRAKLFCKLFRSTGGKDRERALYQTVISSHETPQQKKVSGGVIGWVKGKLL